MEEDKQNPEHRSNKVRRRQAAGSSSDSSHVENSLENRLLDLEQCSGINDVIVTGLKIKPTSYSKAVEGEDRQDKDRHDESAEAQMTAFLQEKNISIDRDDIETCHTIPVGNKTGRVANHVIIIRFANGKKKVHLLKQGRKLKGAVVYLNEHLIKRNADIAKKARFLRKQGKLQSTCVF
ncbi:hypothetical protein ABVT39_018155 [Epinephelus coioides]